MSHCTVRLRGKRNIINPQTAVAVGHKVYAFGGYNWDKRKPQENQLNVYVFNTVSLRWMTLPPVKTTRGELPPEVPCSRYRQTAVLIEDIVYIWGGKNMHGLCNNVLYAFDVDTHRWLNSDVSGTVPEAKYTHSACALGKVMYVFGGRTMLTTCTNDIYKLDTTTMVWSLINTGLPPVLIKNQTYSCHSATIIGTKMFVFGGLSMRFNNVSVFDTETNCWLNTPHAQPLAEERESHSAFAYNGELYIFGGEYYDYESRNVYYDYESRKSSYVTCDDMWIFSPETFSWKEVKPKVNDPFWMRDGCCCMVGNRVIIFGGSKYYKDNDDLYILDLSPSLKTLCKLAVIQYGLEQSELPHNIRWELTAMTDGELEDSA